MRRPVFVVALLLYLAALGAVIQAQNNPVPKTLSPEMRQTLQQVFDRSRPAAVRIETIPEGVGSGFFISRQGLVMTAYHVARDAVRLRVVTANQKAYPAQLVGYDELRDLAILQAEVPIEVAFFELETRQGVRPGDPLVNLGNSGGQFIAPRPGLVTAIDRSIRADFPAGMISSTMPLAPGDSGGPVVNAAGKVVAVAVAIGYSDEAGFQSYVAPLVGLEGFIGQLQAGYQRDAPYIGINPLEITDEVAQHFKIEAKGVLLQRVLPGGAGDKAGLRGINNIGPDEVPDVILEVEGVAVNDFASLIAEVRKHSVGDSVTLTLRRAGKIMQVKLVLAPLPRRT